MTETEPGTNPLVPTPLQLKILRAKIDGKTDIAVARACKISERTLRRELAAVAAQVGVSSRAGLFAEAVRRGWLDQIAGPAYGP